VATFQQTHQSEEITKYVPGNDAAADSSQVNIFFDENYMEGLFSAGMNAHLTPGCGHPFLFSDTYWKTIFPVRFLLRGTSLE
jgi:hypothetical protein